MEEIPLATLWPNGGGLFVHFPGFELYNFEPNFYSPVFVVPRIVTIPQKQRFMSPPEAWWTRWYRLQLLPDGKGGHPPIEHNPEERKLQYAVIMYTDLHEDFLPAPAILGTIGPVKEQSLGEESLSTIPETELGQQLRWSLVSDRPKTWLPIDIFPKRIAFRYICRALVDMPEQETLIGAKNMFKTCSEGCFQDNERKMVEGMRLISATVYSRNQKWCIL
jgi:hypothetical protein